MNIFCSTYPFGSVDPRPIDILNQHKINLELNPYKRKITAEELKRHLSNKTGLIAGTERLNAEILNWAPKLRIIARVGIGLDGIDFNETKKRGILVTYTPDAVSQAVAELTVANILNLARSVPQIHMSMKAGNWNRIIGFEIAKKKVGIIGFGRIGQRVAKMLTGFDCNVMVNDIVPFEGITGNSNIRFCSKEEMFSTADIVTLHIPKTPMTNNLVNKEVLDSMKKTACLINTSRGGIVVEDDLYSALQNKDIAGAAIDVFEIEPYRAGRLGELDNIILTSHSGSCSKEARYLMEYGAAQEIVRYFTDQPPINPVENDTITVEEAKEIIPINAEWHEIIQKAESKKDEKYNLYRRRWGQYPTYSIVGKYPLNIDIELVSNKIGSGSSQTSVFFSKPKTGSSFMDLDILREIITQINVSQEPVAIKIGYRGDPIFYPELEKALELIKEAGSVETFFSTRGDYNNYKFIECIVENKIDFLNIYTEYNGPFHSLSEAKKKEVKSLSQWLDELKRFKAMRKSEYPRVRVYSDMVLADSNSIHEFSLFWNHWADVVAVVDKEVGKDLEYNDDKIKWVCPKIWQRMAITHNGDITVCNYDFNDQYILGNLADISITEAWNSKKINRLRHMHRANKAHTIEPCRSCAFRSLEIKKLVG